MNTDLDYLRLFWRTHTITRGVSPIPTERGSKRFIADQVINNRSGEINC